MSVGMPSKRKGGMIWVIVPKFGESQTYLGYLELGQWLHHGPPPSIGWVQGTHALDLIFAVRLRHCSGTSSCDLNSSPVTNSNMIKILGCDENSSL